MVAYLYFNFLKFDLIEITGNRLTYFYPRFDLSDQYIFSGSFEHLCFSNESYH
jgi:hypothetical protein